MEPDNIVFYWSGEVPPITELCFLSALNKSTHSRIHLFLDEDIGYEGSLDPSLDWLKDHPRFELHSFSLSNWVLQDLDRNPRNRYWSVIRNLLCIAMDKWVTPKVSNRLSKLRVTKRVLGSWHMQFGWFPVADSIFLLENKGHAYRADVFRALIPKYFPLESILYSDLDVFFSAPFHKWNLKKGFTYRWGESSWANTAILFYPRVHKNEYESIIRDLNSDIPALPWFLFQEDSCERFGIDIKRVELFDPGWTKSSPLSKDTRLFFMDSTFSKEIIEEIETKFYAAHWHNQWKTKPSQGSVYSILLNKERSVFAKSAIF
jgi:hypothetical protein